MPAFSTFYPKRTPFLQVPWSDLYAKMGSYGAIERHHIDEQQQNRPQSSDANTIEASFTLCRTAKTDGLKVAGALDCGNASVPIKWAASERRLRRSEASPSILDHLNDHCLRQIFESRALSIEDRVSIGKSCARFNYIAAQAFAYKHSRAEHHIREPAALDYYADLFMLFGHHIESIILADHDIFTNLMLGFVAKYCPNVRRLCTPRLAGMVSAIASHGRLSPEQRQRIPAPFARLRTLKFKAAFAKVVAPLAAIELPSLRHFYVQRQHFKDLPAAFQAFFARNGRLTALGLADTNLRERAADVVALLPRLVALDLVEFKPRRLAEFCASEEPDGEAIDEAEWLGRPLQQLATVKLSARPGERFASLFTAIHDAAAPVECLELCAPYGTDVIYRLRDFRQVKRGVIDIELGARQEKVLRFVQDNEQLEYISVCMVDMAVQLVHDVLRTAHAPLKVATFQVEDSQLHGRGHVLDEIERTRLARGIELTMEVQLDMALAQPNEFGRYEWMKLKCTNYTRSRMNRFF